MAANLAKRGSVYYVRVSAPEQLKLLRRDAGTRGKNDVWVSLRTKDLSTAKRLRPAALERIYRAFEEEEAELRGQGARDVAWTRPSPADLERAAFAFKHDELVLDERVRADWPSQSEIDKRLEATRHALTADPPKTELEKWVRPGGLADLAAFAGRRESDHDRRQALATELQDHLKNQNFVLVDWAVSDLARRNHWEIEHDSSEYKTLARNLIRAWIQALKSSFQRDEGVYEEPATVTPIVGAASGSATPAGPTKAKKGESLSDYLDAYLREQKKHVRLNTRTDLRATIRQFMECNGDRMLTSYNRGDMASFKRLLSEAPARSERLYPGIPLPKATELNRRDGHPKLKSNSIRNKLSAMSAFGAWLESNVPGVDAQSFSTTLPPKTDADRMEPFSDEEIHKILNARAFIGCRSERNQLEPGEYKIHDERFWMPLIAAFTGARLNEITQLTVDDVSQVEGIWAFRITDEGVGQSVKNTGSRRTVPVHPRLIELGLLEFRRRALKNGKTDLFHEFRANADGRRSDHAGKWFRKFLVRIGVKVPGSLGGAHRWRHTLTDALRRGGVDDYQIARVLGHKVDATKMTGHYGRESSMTLKQKHDLLTKAHYPTVDFDLLMPAAGSASGASE